MRNCVLTAGMGENKAKIEEPLKNELRQRVVLGSTTKCLRGETIRADSLV